MAANYSINKDTCNVFSSDTLSNLTDGFLNVLQPEAVRVEKSLQELTTNQEEMLLSIQNKGAQFEDTTRSEDINELLQEIPVYKQKLISVQKNIAAIDKKMKRLQARSNKLKELRISRDLQTKKELEKRIREEQLLEAKPSK